MKCLAGSPDNRWDGVEALAQAYRSVRQTQKAFGELHRLTIFAKGDNDWSTDAVRRAYEKQK